MSEENSSKLNLSDHSITEGQYLIEVDLLADEIDNDHLMDASPSPPRPTSSTPSSQSQRPRTSAGTSPRPSAGSSAQTRHLSRTTWRELRIKTGKARIRPVSTNTRLSYVKSALLSNQLIFHDNLLSH